MSKNPRLPQDIVQYHLSPFVDSKTTLALLQTSKQFAPMAGFLPHKQVLSLWNQHCEDVEKLEIKSTATPRRSLEIRIRVMELGPPTREELREMGPPSQAIRIWKEYFELLLLYHYYGLFSAYIDIHEWFLNDEIGEMSAEQDDVKRRIDRLPLRYIPELLADWYRNVSNDFPCRNKLPELEDEQYIVLVLFRKRAVEELSDKEILRCWKRVDGTLPLQSHR